MTSSEIAYLVRKERTGSSKLSVMKLDQELVIVGRSPSANYILPTPMISRNHAVLRRNEESEWTVMDNKSVNGVFVNLKKLDPMVPVCLKDGEEVRFGMNFESESFNYVFRSSLTDAEVREIRQKTRKHRLKELSPTMQVAPDKLKKTEFLDVDVNDVVKENRELELQLQQMKDLLDEKSTRELALKEEMERKEEEIKSKKDLEQQLQQMEQLLQERRAAEEALHKEMEEKERQIKFDVQHQVKEEKERLEREAQLKYKRDLQTLEENLRDQIESQREALVAEKTQVEKQLQTEIEKTNLEMQNQLKAEQERLAKVIAAKEVERSLLEQRLKDAAESNEKNLAAALSARHEVLANFGEMLEVELQCCICSELIIQATTLNCSHSFCKFCVVEWMKKHLSKPECPVCRAAIKYMSPSVVIDSFIDSIMEQLPVEKKAERKTLNDQRKGQSATQVIPPAVAAKFSQGNSAASVQPKPGQSVSTTIDITTDSYDDDDDDDMESDSDYDDESDGAYYGGYGHCFTCGARGHWSNSCPYR